MKASSLISRLVIVGGFGVIATACSSAGEVESTVSSSQAESTGGSVALFHSDRCDTSELLATIGPATSCASLSAQISSRVWGVRIDGQCLDVTDTDVGAACERFKGGGAAIFHSDRCEASELLASLGPGSDCDALGT
jgi:hypothetical protein